MIEFDYKTPIEAHNIILRGDFNPKIFQPAWFGNEGLITESEAESANIQIIHQEVTIFSLNWLQFEVSRDRVKASTTQTAYYEVLRDLIIGTFSILRHTPIYMLGINYDFHIKLNTREEWHNIGNALAPKKYWDNILMRPGTRSLTIEGERDDEYDGYFRVKIEPSTQIDPGIFFNMNDHYQVKEPDNLGADYILNILQSQWNVSKTKSYSTYKNVINSVLKSGN